LPNVATTLNGSIMLLLGDLSMSSTIGSRGGIEIKTSTQRLMDADQVLWRGRERMDIVNHDLGDADLFVSIERRIALGIDVPLCEFEAVLFACYAGPYGDFHTAKVFA
jgi:hypothetical protein